MNFVSVFVQVTENLMKPAVTDQETRVVQSSLEILENILLLKFVLKTLVWFDYQ